jgi:MarR family transcriptional regulator, temperature-dependent positive regulator of motility
LLEKQSITHPQFIVRATLAYLSQRSGEITQVIVSNKTNIDVMTISQILENLEKSYIKCSCSIKDSRAKSIQLPPKELNKANETMLNKKRTQCLTSHYVRIILITI